MLLQLFQLLIHLFVYPSKHFRIRSIHILYVRCFREYFQNCSQFFWSNAWKSFYSKENANYYLFLQFITDYRQCDNNCQSWNMTTNQRFFFDNCLNHGCTHYLSCYLWILFCQMVFLNSRINVRKREVSSQ